MFFCILEFIFILNSLVSQNTQWLIYNNTNSGLPANNVNVIIVDSNNIKWFGVGRRNEFENTVDLVKFDNHNWISYNMHSFSELDHQINSIAVDSKGYKWIATEYGGVIKYNDINWQIFNSLNSQLPYDNVNSIAIDSYDNKWIGTDGLGLVKFDDKKWTIFNKSNSGLPLNYVGDILIEGNSTKWLACGGLTKFDEPNWIVYMPSSNTLPGGVSSIKIDKLGNKWIGSKGIGLIKFDGINWVLFNKSNSGLPDNDVEVIEIDNEGTIWIGTNYNGLVKFDGINWTIYNNENTGFPLKYIRSIAIDKHGNKWIGKAEDGIIVYNENGIDFNHYSISGKINYDNIYKTPIKSIKIDLLNESNEVIDSTFTDSTGFYMFNKVEFGNYKCNPIITLLSGGINLKDALYISKNFVKVYQFEDELLKAAADVTGDGNINSTDALYINLFYVNLIDKFKINNWLFDKHIIHLYNKNIVKNIRVVCAGDADGSYVPYSY